MHHRIPSSRRFAAPLLAVLAGTLVLSLLGPSAPTAQGIGYSPAVDQPSSYDAQRTCTRAPRPGTAALSRWLLQTYPVTRSLGMMRACGRGGTSEHKDGRAFDWGADVRNVRQRRAANTFIRLALATDAAGNRHALARRMGIMYLIYRDTIWSSYRDFQPRPYLNAACKSRKKCSRTLRHLNHVHISLGYAGAAAQTSWYRGRNVASQPVLFPGTAELDPEKTAVTGFTVPATGTNAWTPFWLRAGVSYRFVVTGTVRYDAGALGDARCTWTDGAAAPTPTPVGLLGLPLPETRGLLQRGTLRWEDEDCRADHTYQAWYTPLVSERVPFRYADLTPAGNTGTFTVYVAREDILASSLVRR